MNWKQLIADMLETGWTYRRLAERTSAGLGTIHDLGSGNSLEPRYELGRQLLDLHKRSMRSAAGKVVAERRKQATRQPLP